MRLIFFISFLLLMVKFVVAQQLQHNFKIGENDFLLDEKPFQIISGEMHFARIPREYWHDRLRTAKEMGLNTICTYVFWNYHETEKGIYNFTGNADVAAFVKAAQEEGLWVIVRPSPYACAEWEFGGYPWWLLNEKNVKVRSRDSIFLDMSKKYIQAFAKELAPLQITKGGPIIMVQIENEYGSYDADKEYLAINKDMLQKAGFEVDFYTCDGPEQMPRGYLAGVLPAVNGYDNIQGVKNLINTYNHGHGPYFIAEWYPAWFDSWGENHHKIPVESFIETYKKVLDTGYSINIYMVHGGTTRDFWNGANMPPYRPQTSSYDYDAPIDEAGNITPKYLAMQKVIYEHFNLPVPIPKRSIRTIEVPSIIFKDFSDIFSNLPKAVESEKPMTFEQLGQGYGFVLYETTVNEISKKYLTINHVRDYALIFLNGKRVGILDRRLNQDSILLEVNQKNALLQILVENMGRINYGEFLNDNHKGITESVFFGDKELINWKMYSLPFHTFPEFKDAANTYFSMPTLKRANFDLDETGDCWLDVSNWGKGVIWLNGHNLGRYWNIGPTQTIYIPAPWLKLKDNELIILDELNYNIHEIRLINKPILDVIHAVNVGLKPQLTAQNKLQIQLFSSDSMSDIFYTIDNNIPTNSSNKYTKPFSIEKACTLNVKAINEVISAEDIKSFHLVPSLSCGSSINYLTQYHKKYPGNSNLNLIDGICGSLNYNDGFWQGYEATDLDVIVDLKAVKSVRSVQINFLKDTKAWIFLPQNVEISVSEDGKNYQKLEAKFNSDNSLLSVNKIENAKAFLGKSQKIKYIHIRAKNLGQCPDDHIGKGSPAWMFVDEIEVL